MTSPIWKDTTYTSSTSALSYTINVDGSSIFSGTSVAPPDGGPIEIRLNDICENWLHTEMPDFRSSVEKPSILWPMDLRCPLMSSSLAINQWFQRLTVCSEGRSSEVFGWIDPFKESQMTSSA